MNQPAWNDFKGETFEQVTTVELGRKILLGYGLVLALVVIVWAYGR